MRRQLLAGLAMVVVLTVLTGGAYPLLLTAVAQGVFGDKADGSLIRRDGLRVGSALIAQPFTGAGYFHPRPSYAGDGYDATDSGGSNLGPTNPALLDEVKARAAAYRRENGLSDTTKVPVDAVTASASGLDPHISVANARIQARRVAAARRLPPELVLQLVDFQTEGRGLGFLGEPSVNVLRLNLVLVRIAGPPST